MKGAIYRLDEVTIEINGITEIVQVEKIIGDEFTFEYFGMKTRKLSDATLHKKSDRRHSIERSGMVELLQGLK